MRSTTRAKRRPPSPFRPALAAARSKWSTSRTCRSLIFLATPPACMSKSWATSMSRNAYPIRESDLLPLALGAALLGTGGGGNPYIGMLRLRELLRAGHTVDVIPLEALRDDDFVGSVGGIGAPVVGVEKIKQGEECLRALPALGKPAGIKVSR